MKVFCNNCRWFRTYVLPKHHSDVTIVHGYWGNCFHVACFKVIEKSYEKTIIRKYNIEGLNGKNNCSFFHRKWWKFWVKPKRNCGLPNIYGWTTNELINYGYQPKSGKEPKGPPPDSGSNIQRD